MPFIAKIKIDNDVIVCQNVQKMKYMKKTISAVENVQKSEDYHLCFFLWDFALGS